MEYYRNISLEAGLRAMERRPRGAIMVVNGDGGGLVRYHLLFNINHHPDTIVHEIRLCRGRFYVFLNGRRVGGTGGVLDHVVGYMVENYFRP